MWLIMGKNWSSYCCAFWCCFWSWVLGNAAWRPITAVLVLVLSCWYETFNALEKSAQTCLYFMPCTCSHFVVFVMMVFLCEHVWFVEQLCESMCNHCGVCFDGLVSMWLLEDWFVWAFVGPFENFCLQPQMYQLPKPVCMSLSVSICMNQWWLLPVF